ncbi:trypsin-like peptidase domain-containing protein [bacterium]|nr:trypsin-like peptidase domain-containing protein [bacterium]
MTKRIIELIVIFVIGMVGGIFSTQVLWPSLVERPLSLRYNLEASIVDLKKNQKEVKEVFIQENTALQDAIDKVSKVVVGIKSETRKGEIKYGTGLIITSDGLIITSSRLTPLNSKIIVYQDNAKIPAKIIQKKGNFSVLKVEKDALPTLPFVTQEKTRLGERVFLLEMCFDKERITRRVDEGIVSYLHDSKIRTSIDKKITTECGFLFDIEGKIFGMLIMDSKKRPVIISSSEIKDFLGF